MSTDHLTPEATIARFSELLSQGRIEALLNLFESDAAFAPEPGRAVVGTASIRRSSSASRPWAPHDRLRSRERHRDG